MAQHRIWTAEENWVEDGGDDVVFLGRSDDCRRYLVRCSYGDADGCFPDIRYNDCQATRFSNAANRRFYMRLFKPESPVGNVAIIYNGLDETVYQLRDDDLLFGFYDRLGAHLANNGVQAILLPTPYHMNRAMCYASTKKEKAWRKKHPALADNFTTPTDALMRRPSNIYLNHFLGYRETRALAAVLRREHWVGELPTFSERARLQLTEQLLPDVAISLVGYSLGGLRALTEFIHDRTVSDVSILSACVALSSGGALSDLQPPPWVDGYRWGEMISKLMIIPDEPSETERRFFGIRKGAERSLAAKHYRILEDVFLGKARSFQELERLDPRGAAEIFFLVGGGDDLVPLSSLERFSPSGGISVLQVANLGHMYRYGALHRWEKAVLQLVTEFLRSASDARRRRAHPEDIADIVALLDFACGVLHYRQNLLEPGIFDRAIDELKQQSDGEAFLKTALAADVSTLEMEPGVGEFVRYACNVVRRLESLLQERECHPGIYKRARRNLLLGWHITHDAGLVDQWQHFVSDEARIGTALVQNGVISAGQRKTALRAQEIELRRVRALMVRDILEWRRRQ